MKRKLETTTLFSRGNPAYVICPGHVDQKTFNQAHKNEGWVPGGGYKQKDLVYGFGRIRKSKNGNFFKVCSPSHPKAKKFTWTNWD